MTLIPPDFLPAGCRWLTQRWLGVVLCLILGCSGMVMIEGARVSAQGPEDSPAPTAENKEHRPGMDRFDMRAAEEPAQAEKLSLAQKSFERQRWDEGVQQLQALLNEDQDSLILGEDQVWRPTSEMVLELVGKFPNGALTAYVTRFGTLADRDLTQARRTRELSALLLIARRYLLTSAGQQASRDLIDALIDHGNTDSIARLVKDLVRIESVQLQDVRWRAQLINVLQETGYTSLAGQLQEIPETQPATDSVWALASFGLPSAPIREWTTLSGSPTGQAITQIEESTLLPRWRQPLISSPRVRQILQDQDISFEEQGAMGLSVLSTIGSGEILVTRTLSNLTAVNINTGKVLWTSREWGLMSPDSDAEEEDSSPQIELNMERDAEGSLNNRIRLRLTSCGSLGTLSANSRYVFSLASFNSEQTPLESIVQPGFDESEHPDKYLYARDLKTGRIAWRAGGPSSEEAPGLPAAGVSFFGPPTPDGDELLGVGERDGDILLLCLEAETGIVRWEQLLASAGRRLTDDVVRRSWTAPVAVRGSLAICPTTTGWVTAFDRVTRRILWSQRLVERAQPGATPSDIDLAFDSPNRDVGLDERWPPLQPILLRDRVLFAPIELPDETGATLPRLFCFDLLSGEKLWEVPKNQAVGVIGATEEMVYLFDQRTVQAYRCDTGVQAWKCTSLKSPIAGRPVLTPDGIVVPTHPCSLVRIDAAQGKIVERSDTEVTDEHSRRLYELVSPKTPRPFSLGNLISLEGRLISVSPYEMAALEWKSDESKWQSEARANASAALNWAKSLAVHGRYAEAIQALRDAVPLFSNEAVSNDAAKSSFSKQMLVLLLILQAETQRGEVQPDSNWRAWLSEARPLTTSPEDLEAIQRLEIELAIQASEWDAAWAQIRTAIRLPLRFRFEIDQRIVSPDAWLADQIRAVAQIPDRTQGDAMRELLRTEFVSLWKEAAAQSDERQRLLRLFTESAFVDASEMEWIATSEEPSRLARLEALALSRDRTAALTAAVRLIEALANPDWVGEARRRLKELPDATTWPQEFRPTRLELHQLLDRVTDVHRQPPPSWLGASLEVVRWAETDFDKAGDIPIFWIGKPNEALQNFHYSFDQDRETLIIERQDGSLYCELPLSTGNVYVDSPLSPVLYGSGLNLYLIHTGMIHAFSLPEKRRLWKRSGSLSSDHDPRRYPRNNVMGPLQNPKALRDQVEDYALRFSATSFEVANSRQVVIRSRRGIEVLCALTGQLLWEQPRCPTETVRCDEDRMYRMGGNRVRALSIRSGRPLTVTGLSEFSSTLCPLDTHGITTLSEQPGDGQTWQLQGYQVRGEPIAHRNESNLDRWDESDRLQFAPVWSLPIGIHSRLGAGPPGGGIWLNESGELKLIPWASGRPQLLGKSDITSLNGEDSQSDGVVFNSVWDRFHVYLLSDTSPGTTSLDCPAVPVHGSVFVFSRDRSELEWKFPFEGFLLTDTLARCPQLALIRLEDSQVAGYPYQKVQLSLVDKQSGKVVHEINTKSFGTGLSGSMFDPKMLQWGLFLQGETMRIKMKPAVAP